MITREQERQIRGWLVRHMDDGEPPQVATLFIAELLNTVVELRLQLAAVAPAYAPEAAALDWAHHYGPRKAIRNGAPDA